MEDGPSDDVPFITDSLVFPKKSSKGLQAIDMFPKAWWLVLLGFMLAGLAVIMTNCHKNYPVLFWTQPWGVRSSALENQHCSMSSSHSPPSADSVALLLLFLASFLLLPNLWHCTELTVLLISGNPTAWISYLLCKEAFTFTAVKSKWFFYHSPHYVRWPLLFLLCNGETLQVSIILLEIISLEIC